MDLISIYDKITKPSDNLSVNRHLLGGQSSLASFYPSATGFPREELTKFDLSKFHMQDIIHIGLTSTTILALKEESEETVVLKSFLSSMRLDDGKDAFNDFLNELQILVQLKCVNNYTSDLRCPYILTLYGYGFLLKQPVLVMETLQGSMKDVLETLTENSSNPALQKLTPDSKLYHWITWSLQMVKAVEYIHSKNIIHCAIKPEHFMFHGYYIMDYVVLTNFTHAHRLSEQTQDPPIERNPSSLFFAKNESYILHPPEFYTNEHISNKVDIWCICLILLELFSGGDSLQYEYNMDEDEYVDKRPPFAFYSICDHLLTEFESWVFFKIQNHNLNSHYFHKCSSISILIKDTIFSIIYDGLKIDPHKRPSATEISKSLQLLQEAVNEFLKDLNFKIEEY